MRLSLATAGRRTVGLAALFAAAPALAQPFGLSRAQFRANTYATGDQKTPAVAVDGTGAFLVVWTDAGLDQNGNGVFGKRYTRQAVPIGAFNLEFQLNTHTTGSQYGPAAAAIGTGTYVVAWTSADQDGSGNGVYAQMWGPSGAIGSEFRVNTGTFSHQAYPAVAADGSGNFVIAWRDAGDIRAQRYSSAGAMQGADFMVNTHATGFEVQPAVARSSAGDFVIAWFDGNNYYDVQGQRYNASGSRVGAEFTLNTTGGPDFQRSLSAAWGPNGFFVTWGRSGVSTGQYDVVARRFASTGVPIGNEFRLNTVTGSARDPRIAMDSTGAFMVVWTSSAGPSLEVFARRFSAAGAAIGADFRLNTTTTDNQSKPAIASSPDGRLVVAWHSRSEDGSNYGVFAQAACQHLAGDADGNGTVDIADVFFLINHLFAGGPAPVHGSDANGDGTLDIADVFYLINALFAGGPGPACA